MPKDLMKASSMDGPTVKWAPNDVLKGTNPRVYLAYHVTSSGFGHLNALGAVGGAIVGMTPLQAKFPNYSALQLAGNGGLMLGCTGMLLGLGGMYAASRPNAKPKIPWSDEGLQMRVDGLSHNFKVRSLDLGVWIGVASAGGLLLAAGGPSKLNLSSGTLGCMQAVSLGSAAGGWAAIITRSIKN